MREYTLEQLKPRRQELISINKHLFSTRSERLMDSCGEDSDTPRKLASQIGLQYWKKLSEQGLIVKVTDRTWTMDFDS